MASCATPRVPKSKRDVGRAGGALARSPFFRFYLGVPCFFVFLMEKKLLYGGKARVLRGGRDGWKGSETANHPGGLRWLLSVDNAPIRQCVPRNAIPFTQRNPKLREIPGCMARPHYMHGVTHLGGGLCADFSKEHIQGDPQLLYQRSWGGTADRTKSKSPLLLCDFRNCLTRISPCIV